MAKQSDTISEPSMLVKPISKFGGLDTIHIALIILVVVLVLLVAAISYNSHIVVINETGNQTTTIAAYGTPVHNASQAKQYAESVLAGYASINDSLSILPFISNVSAMTLSYLPSLGEWYASVPYISPINNATYAFAIVFTDSNFQLVNTYAQAIRPPSVTDNYVIAPGVVKIAKESSCVVTNPTQVYWFVDPYAPGAMSSLVNAANLKSRLGSEVNISIRALSTQYSTPLETKYGLNSTLTLGRYLECSSNQKNFTGFIDAVNASYPNGYMPQYVIQAIANESGFNETQLGSCITSASSQSIVSNLALLARYYNVTSSSTVITDCQYLSLPQTVANAACYANSTLCGEPLSDT